MNDLHFLRPLWVLAFLSLALVMLIALPSAQAFEWRDLWMRDDQQAARNLSQGQAGIAARQFADPAWRGVALYQAGDYIGAAEAFAQSQDVNAGYNRGNAFAKSGQLEQAVLAYREVLREVPEHTDAKANLALIEELLQQQFDQSNEEVQDDQQLQEPLQSDNSDNSQLKPEDHEDSEDGGDSAENAESDEMQASTQNDRGDGSESDQREDGSNGDEMLPSDQMLQANDVEAARQDVRDQKHQQDQLVENQMSAEEQAKENDRPQSDDNNDNEIVLPSDQTQQTDDMEAAREDVEGQVQEQEQFFDNQLSAEQPAEYEDQPLSDRDELKPAHQDREEMQHQQDLQMENQLAIEQLSDEMGELLLFDRTYDETEMTPDQWLRLVPDDPSGLLRRKFMLEHLRRQQNTQ